jgi:uncharacterized protein (TIGR00369 family)
MEKVLKGKRISDSKVRLSQLMQVEHTNLHGNVHGGWVMKLMDEAGALACMRHSQTRVVTVAVDKMVFKQPIHVGDLVNISAEVSYVGKSSMEARIEVTAENPLTGDCVYTNTAFFVYVALGPDEKPVMVPPLIIETEQEHRMVMEGKARQTSRLAENMDQAEIIKSR